MSRNLSLWTGCSLLVLMLLMMTVGPYLPFVDRELKEEIVRMEGGTIEVPPYPPSIENPFGSDERGKDVFSMIILGAKDTMAIVFAITLVRYLIAVPLGLLASSYKGPAHWIVTGWNQLFSALPALFSAILIMNFPFLLFNDHRLEWSIMLIAVIEVGRIASVVQQQSHSLSKRLFVEAGVTMGFTPVQNYQRNYMPNLLPELCIMFFIDLGRVALLIGQLGMLSIFISQAWVQTGFANGVIVNTNLNWATLLGSARNDLLLAPWIPLFSAGAIMLLIFMFNLIGEGLRNLLDRRAS